MSGQHNIILKSAAWAARHLPPSFKRFLYRTPLLARLARRTLNTAAPGGLSEVIVAAGVLQGMRMQLDLQSEKDYWLGTYEEDLQSAARRIIQTGMVVYDVGANIGYISLMAAKLCGQAGRVFAFEALPKNAERLASNVGLNGLCDRVTLVQAAVTGQTGEIAFLTHASGAMGKVSGSAGREEQYGETLRVAAIALDDYVFQSGHPAPQVVKMDIEGGEGLALRGMSRLLRENRPTLLIELHGQDAARQVWEILRANHYQICQMTKTMPEILSLDDLGWKAYIVALPPNEAGSLGSHTPK